MSRSALACLPAAILAAFVGVIATPAESRASSPSVCSRSETISLQRPDERQFENDPGGPVRNDSADRVWAAEHPGGEPAPWLGTLESGGGPIDRTAIVPVPPSEREAGRAMSAVMDVAMVVGTVVLMIAMISIFANLHSETPASTVAIR